ncbi:hypothetical protein BH09SUM1_BH09SUM1_07760 [soil metagenome]
MKRASFLALTFCLLAHLSSAQTVNTITAAGLGYPVPTPVDSQTPVTGFRSYDSLNARFLDLATSHSFMQPANAGATIEGRQVTVYRFSIGTTTQEGAPKSASFLQATLHAREWAAPETAAAVIEWLAENGDTDAVAKYLLENMEIVINPIGNPDGFVQTQRYPTSTISGGSSGSAGNDGRMRRKNMHDVDTILSTTNDYTLGVDLNRNHTVGFGAAGSSGSVSNQTYRGTAVNSEPETAATYAAAALLNTSRIRFAIDYHSYDQAFYVNLNGAPGHDTAGTEAYAVMRDVIAAVHGTQYDEIAWSVPQQAYGATDEYFCGTYGAMSYTLEIRPNSGSNGFILPAADAPAVRDELTAGTRAGLYYAAGPAAVLDIEVFDTTDTLQPGASIYHHSRTYNSSSARRDFVTNGGALESGEKYLVAIRFNKPMRHYNGSQWKLFDGLTGVEYPSCDVGGVASASGVSWGAAGTFRLPLRYEGDTAWVLLDLTTGAAAGTYPLQIRTVDMAGVPIDSDAATVADWSSAGWTNYETATAGDASAQVTIGNSQGDIWMLH